MPPLMLITRGAGHAIYLMDNSQLSMMYTTHTDAGSATTISANHTPT
ncbi:MAG: hypothetical protein IB616_04345 [Methanosarcinales archaeon]|nr:MAG: hypothetical protein IB616_04345 [Methanosarcinales archaeon]